MTVRRWLTLLLFALAAATGIASAVGHAAAPRPLLAVLNGRKPIFVHLDPSTFARSDRKQLAQGDFQGWTLSPDGSRLVLGSDHRMLRFIDPVRLRVLGDLRLSRPGNIGPSAWFGDRLVLVSQEWTQRSHYVRTIDTARRRVLSVRTLVGAVAGRARTPEALVLLLTPEKGIGPSTLAVIEPEGRIRTVVLDRIPSGWTSEEEEEFSASKVYAFAAPALVVDPSGRAFVVGGGTPVAEIDLSTLAVAYHALPTGATPDALRKGGADGPSRHAVWLGNGIFALSGVDDHGWIDDQGHAQTRQTPAGLVLVDTRTWTTRVLNPGASTVWRWGALLYAQSFVWDSATSKTASDGLAAYGLDGVLRYHLWPGELVVAEPLDERLIVEPEYPRLGYWVVDAATGTVLRTVRGARPPYLILPSA